MERVMYRGDDRSFEFTLTADGVPMDLTGASIVFSGKADIDDVLPEISLSTDDGGVVIDPDQDYGMGLVTLHIPSAATVDFERHVTLLCDFQVTDTYGDIRTWPEAVYGQSTLLRFRVKADVTT